MKLYIFSVLIIFAINGKCFGIDDNPRYTASEEVLAIIRDPERYNKNIMPYSNESSPLEVTISMHILHIDVDDVNMRTNVALYFRMHWNDPRLSYKSEVDSVTFTHTSDFWIPDAFFRNSFKTETMNSILPESYVRISGNGDVTHSARFFLNLKCAMNLKRFPLDQQNCPLYVASYGYSMEDMVFVFKTPEAFNIAKTMVGPKRFILSRVTSDYCTARTVTGNYTCIYLLFGVDRTFDSYLLEFYLPCLSLVITAFLAEVLDPALILPRLLITIGPLLTLTAISLSYHQTLPSVPYVTAMDVYCGVSLLVIFVIVLHILVSFYFSSKLTPEPKSDEEDQNSKWKNICKKMKNNANNLVKLLIFVSYVLFLIFYFIAYNI